MYFVYYKSNNEIVDTDLGSPFKKLLSCVAGESSASSASSSPTSSIEIDHNNPK